VPWHYLGVPERRRFPDAVLTTDRLTLRPFNESDVEAVLSAVADPVIHTWLPLPDPYTRRHAQLWCCDTAPAVRRTGRGLVRAVEAASGLVGSIDLKRTDWEGRVTEIGYWTSASARGNGVMTEATRALARWVLDVMGFARVELRIASGNAASIRVAQKAGFVREGVARSAGYVHAGRVDLVIYSLIRADLGLPQDRPESTHPG
jgi:RimJ/RimL family protein N-acetyltransferase